MTLHVLFADPPRSGQALPELVHNGSLEPEAARTLSEAMLQDTAAAVAASGGDLLVNHPPDAGDADTEPAPEAAFRELLGEALADLESVRFEPQVGDTPTERIENACRHLLDEEEVAWVAVLDGRAPTIDRTTLDSAGMKLRRSEVIIGPAPRGRVAYLGLTEPLDLEGLDWPFGLEPLVERAVGAGLAVDFLPLHPWLGDQGSLETVVALIKANRQASRGLPEHTAATIDSLGL